MRLTLIALLMALALGAQTRTATLTWTDTVNAAGTTYNVYRVSSTCPTPVALSTFTKINAAPILTKTYDDQGLATGVYCYAVTATQAGLESTPSNTASANALPYSVTGLDVKVTVIITVQTP